MIMTRWDYIEYCGKEECAKAIAYCLVMTTKRGRVTCEDLQDLVKELEPTLVEWLKEEVDVDLYPEE